MEGRYNTRSPAVKRLMKEAQELSEPTDQYFAQPLEDNLFEWHFTVRGPADSDFESGIYHGRIILPVDYPMKPPSIIWLTPNGRFETNKKICLSISGHHPESWQPSWSIRTALLAIIGFMPTHPGGAIGSLDYKPEERKVLAKKSRDWKCPTCGDVTNILLEVSPESSQTSEEAKELATQIAFQGEKPKCKEGECPIEAAATTSTPSASPATTDAEGTSNNAAVNVPPNPGGVDVPRPSSQPPPFPPFTPWGFPVGVMPDASSTTQPIPQPFLSNPYMSNSSQDNSIAARIPRFPYPPSHYPGGYSVPFYPSGFALPPGVGMFPCPLPPPPNSVNGTQGVSSPPLVSVNNSSANSPGSYSRTPMTSPINSRPSRSPSPAPVTQAQESQPTSSSPPSPAKTNVLNELLSKVKRVGSNEEVPPVQDTPNQEATPGAEAAAASEKHEEAGDGSLIDDSVRMEGAHAITDSEVSVSLKKKDSPNELTGTGKSRSELTIDAEENSEIGVPPIEMSDPDQKLNFERSSSSSMSDLEKRLKQGNIKGLRQRQSATARVPAEISEDDQNSGEQASAAGGRQRIEAASGDTTTANQQRVTRHAARAMNEARNVHREALVRVRQRHSPYDASFLLMVGLCVATIIILLNRVLSMIDWSEFTTDALYE